jgi:putative transposase
MPTPQQARALETVLLRCRTLYTCAVEQRRTCWRRGQGRGATDYQQARELPNLKAACPDYAAVHAQVLQDVLRRVDTTYQVFFRRVANGETPGFPRFEGQSRYHSFTYPQYGNGAVVDGGIRGLSKIGRIRLRLHRPIDGTPKTVTVRREADGWYACISCADVPTEPLLRTKRDTGIDVGLKAFLITADGETVANPRHYRTAERALRKAQRRVSRRTKGSRRRRKAIDLLKRTHQRVQRQRHDFHHTTALALLQQYDVIYLEDLQVRNMVRNHHLAKRINDAGWAAFRTILACKAEWAGKRVVAVPAHYASLDCSGVRADGSRCLQRVAKSLSVRTHSCPSRGLVLDCDENAAQNILRAGQARQRSGGAGCRGELRNPCVYAGEHVTDLRGRCLPSHRRHWGCLPPSESLRTRMQPARTRATRRI